MGSEAWANYTQFEKKVKRFLEYQLHRFRMKFRRADVKCRLAEKAFGYRTNMVNDSFSLFYDKNCIITYLAFCGEEMSPFLRFIIRRLLQIPVSLLIITMVLYSGVMLAPPEARARLYLPKGKGGERVTENFISSTIKQNHLDEPYLVQYAYWVRSLLTSSWGYSPTLHDDVLPSLLRRTPVTLELALYSLLLLIPFGLASGLIAGWRPNHWIDGIFRSSAFFGTSMPSFIFALILLSIFYVKLGWFSPGRIEVTTAMEMARSGFVNYTGVLTLDSLLNYRFDIFVTALRHLAMPVFTLSLFHWATLGRITRSIVIGQQNKEYIIAARARGIGERRLLWRHVLATILAPSLTTIALSAASIITGTFVVEIIFGLAGISQVIVISMQSLPDAPAALGFAVYSVLMVIGLMFVLDLVQAVLDPRVRDEVL
jgi:ABC-type dipeptide/oligopeptide/nickel transport system permease component